jgi:hypothetical protein
MKATESIGKDVIRTGPTRITKDFSIDDHPIKIIDADDTNIVYEYADSWHRKNMDTNKHILGSDFCDDQWKEFKHKI